MMIDQDIQIVFNRKIVSETFLMGLRSSEIVETARPGQFVMVRVGAGIDPLLRRPFSICSTKGNDLFLILYKVVGRGTSLMADKREGERLSVLGPLGKGFELPRNGQVPVLVAGGMGIAPLLSLAQSIKTSDVEIMMGAGTAKEIITIDEIVDRYIDVSIATDDGTKGYAGPVTDLLEEYLKLHEPRKDSLPLFTCGPLPMLKSVASIINDRDLSCQVSLEATMACGLGACQGCAIKASSKEKIDYYHVCKDGPVFPVQAIDWNIL
jgi:dihydroorotate dehydrogenase electron transfer subunit